MIKMNEEENTLLKAKLILNYYKKDITDRYVWCVENIVLDNDILNNLNKTLFITTFDKYHKLQNNWNELKKFVEEELDRLTRECSQIYEDSLGKTRLVNTDIFNEVKNISNKVKELEGK